jgi:ribosomal protein L22
MSRELSNALRQAAECALALEDELAQAQSQLHEREQEDHRAARPAPEAGRMTRKMAQAIADIFATADGNCSECGCDLADKAAKVWPDFDWRAMVMESYNSGRVRWLGR